MKNDIKPLYKAKDLHKKEWVFGYYCKVGFANHEKHIIIPDCASTLYGIEIDFDTLCQYIGERDKNRRYIFSGDLLNCGNKIVEVIWNGKTLKWDIELVQRLSCEAYTEKIDANFFNNAIVIGSIFD